MAGIFARIQGDVFRMEHRSGTARESGQPYSMDVAHILVPNAGISEVTLPRPEELSRVTGGAIPVEGQKVDWLVEVSQSPRGLRVSLLRDEQFEAYKAQQAQHVWSTPVVDDDAA